MTDEKHTDQVAEKKWAVYIILSSDQRFYTGITNNIEKRWQAHSHKKTGAKFFRGRSPKQLVYVETEHDRSSASKQEYQLKRLTRLQKLNLVETQKDTNWHLIYKLD